MFYDRILLATIIAGNWALIRIIEELLPDKSHGLLAKPIALYVVLLLATGMAVHTVWLTLAQGRRGFFNTRFENSSKKTPDLKNIPSMDIFVPVHNEEKVIKDTIENLLKLNYPNYFIYLINDRSSDKTKEIIEKYESAHPEKIKLLNLSNYQGKGKPAALNYALEHSRGELITVFDADARVEKDFLLKMIPYLEDEKVAGVQCQKRILNYYANNLTKLQENEYCLDSYFQCGRDVIGCNVEFRGNGQIVKRSILKKVGGWDEETLTDDLELSTRIYLNGYQIRFCPEAIVYEQGPMDFNALVRQRLRWCEGSLRRYLANIWKMFGPGKQPTLAQRFDTLIFLCQYAVPVWLFFDFCSALFWFTTDKETHITLITLSAIAVWIVMWVNLVLSVRMYRKFTWGTSALRAIETNMYFLTMWPTVVLLTFRKVLFSRTKGIWRRTEHYSNVEFEKI